MSFFEVIVGVESEGNCWSRIDCRQEINQDWLVTPSHETHQEKESQGADPYLLDTVIEADHGEDEAVCSPHVYLYFKNEWTILVDSSEEGHPIQDKFKESVVEKHEQACVGYG